jgi:HEAT repeats
MSTARLTCFVAALSLFLDSGCSSGQPSATEEGAVAAPATTAAPEGVSGAAAVAASAPPASAILPAAPPGTPPPAEPEKTKASAKAEETEPPTAPERVHVDMDLLVAGLQSPVTARVFTAGEYFRQLPVAQRREVLLELSKHSDPNVRRIVWRVYSTVATKDDLAALREAWLSPLGDVRLAALETLARFPNDETIGVLTKGLENPDYREFSVGLLSKIGPACEAAVLPHATHSDAAIRRAAWDVLVHAGTRKSVQALEQLTTLPQYQQDEPLKRSLEQLRERLRKG